MRDLGWPPRGPLNTHPMDRTTIYIWNAWLELAVNPPECAARFGLVPGWPTQISQRILLDSLEVLTTHSMDKAPIGTWNDWLGLTLDPPECAARFGLAPGVAIWMRFGWIMVYVWFGFRGAFWGGFGGLCGALLVPK